MLSRLEVALKGLLAAPLSPSVPRPEMTSVWQVALVLASAIMSGTIACVVPFAAMAVIASRTLARRDAVVALFAAVLASQLVGFLSLGFPWTISSVLWAPVFVVATLAAFAVSTRVAQPILALVAAFVAFEAVLAAYSLVTSHSLAAFTAPIVGQIALLNLVLGSVLVLIYLGLVAGWHVATERGARAAQ
jgi:hypothetical protein